MTIAATARVSRNPFERIFAALIDPARSERTMLILLAGYAAAWSLYGAVAKGSQDLHFDIGEMFAWSHQVSLSAPTHPPLGAWLARAWFAVMPRQDWAFYLFGILLATAALWIAWRLAGRYLTPEKRVLGLALLSLLPFYNFHALKYNASSVLTPLWAATTWWFLLSFETRRGGFAALAGFAAGAAMLGKYWSIFLLAGLGLAALSDPRRSAYFRSPAPWLTIAAGAAVLAPHVFWIATHGFTTVDFAFTSHATTLANAAAGSLSFLASVLGYIAVPIALGALATLPSLAIKDTLWPKAAERRTILIAFAAPLILAALAAIAARAELDPLWSMSAMTILPVVLFASPLIAVNRTAAVYILAFAVVFPLLLLAASPVIALVIHRQGVTNYASHYRLIAQAVEQAWRARTNAPLRIVGGNRPVVDGSNFYFADPPATFVVTEPMRTPWVDQARIAREGIAIVCPRAEPGCLKELNAFVTRYGGKTEDVALARRFFGSSGTPVDYQIAIIVPR
ncbi:MAG TPA: glycosyltransferase family 39 protein [Xanthobacteraceae bacterium]|jgi:4-amino-4-deoxy-L-arabinose transferase-like glycosyltransferase|nr:glycosyltransferase family 39 protein [Xanthobacteraceae bacterium]